MVRLLTLRRLFAKVELASLNQFEASYSGLGPRHYPREGMILIFGFDAPVEYALRNHTTHLSKRSWDVAEACEGMSTPSNVHDSQKYLDLLDDLEEAEPKRAYGYAAYDSEAFREDSLSLYNIEIHTPKDPTR